MRYADRHPNATSASEAPQVLHWLMYIASLMYIKLHWLMYIASLMYIMLHWLMYIASLMYIMQPASLSTTLSMAAVQLECSLKGLLECDDKQTETMEIVNDPLPEHIVEDARNARGNIQTKNARYRSAVCDYLGLRWESIAGKGNCFFAAVITGLLSTLPADRTDGLVGDQLRGIVVDWLRLQLSLGDDLAERVQVEIDAEINIPLICSRRGVLRVVPSTREEYLDAVAVDAVWIQGYHWLRAVSYIARVRVGLVIYPFDSVIYFGQGDYTIFLYKADAETHFDALVPLQRA
jgi:hypothetical protein